MAQISEWYGEPDVPELGLNDRVPYTMIPIFMLQSTIKIDSNIPFYTKVPP